MHPLLPPRWQVPEEFSHRLGDKAGRQRAMSADGHLLIVLHCPPKPGEAERKARLFWRNPAGAWHSSDGSNGVAELLEHLAEWDRTVDALEAKARTADEADEYFAIVRATTPLLRAARHQHIALQQARDAAEDSHELIVARDTASDLERTLELLHADASQAMQFLVAARAEEQARASEHIAQSSHRLNLLMAIFLPLTAAASVLGMNVKHGLEDRPHIVFWLVVAACFGLGLMVLAIVVSKNRRS